MPLKFFTPPAMPKVNFLLVGPEKMGKTAGAASLSKHGSVLYANADLENAIRYAHRKYNQTGNIQWALVEGYRTLEEIAFACKSDDPPNTVVIDPVGDVHRIVLEDLSKRAVRPSLPTYGDVNVYLERFLRTLCSLPVNVAIVAHAFSVQDEGSGEVEHLPWTGTKSGSQVLGPKLLAMVDVIGYTGIAHRENEEPQYVSQLIAGGGRRGGDRFACLGPAQPTDLGLWLDIINASEAKEEQDMKDQSTPTPITKKEKAA
jgi:hypothetical protein